MKKDFILFFILLGSSILVGPLAYADKLPESTSTVENKVNKETTDTPSSKENTKQEESKDQAEKIKQEKVQQEKTQQEKVQQEKTQQEKTQQEKTQQDSNNSQPSSTANNVKDSQNLAEINKKLNKQKADDLLMNAMGLLGVNYRFGGTSPINGFDCSGFLQFIFKESLNVSLPRTSRAMAEFGEEVKREHLQAGDLVFFRTTKRDQITHVGMYVGKGNFIHAPRTGKSIEIQSMKKEFYDKRYVTARRVPQITKQAQSFGTSI